MAKRFFYVCLGLLALAVAYHLGPRAASAEGSPGGIHAYYNGCLLLDNGEVWWPPNNPQQSWSTLPGYTPPVPVAEIRFWGPPHWFCTYSGELWHLANDVWQNLGSPPGSVYAYGGAVLLLDNGEVWETTGTPGDPWFPMPVYNPPVPVVEIRFWGPQDWFITYSGELWHYEWGTWNDYGPSPGGIYACYDMCLLLDNGEVWWPPRLPGDPWYTHPLNTPPVPVAEVRFWGPPHCLFTYSRELWYFWNGTWCNFGSPSSGVATQPSTWGGIKAQFK